MTTLSLEQTAVKQSLECLDITLLFEIQAFLSIKDQTCLLCCCKKFYNRIEIPNDENDQIILFEKTHQHDKDEMIVTYPFKFYCHL